MTHRIRFSTMGAAFAALIVLALPAPARTTTARGARETFKEMKSAAADAADEASLLERFIQTNSVSPETYCAVLDQLKQDVNAMGRDFIDLDARRASLETWELQALDKVLPLLEQTAAETEGATLYFNDHRNHLWSPEYGAQAGKIESDSSQIAKTLGSFLKLDQSR